MEHGIYTEYVMGEKYPQSHAWLVVADKRDLERKRRERVVHSYGEFEERSNDYQLILEMINDHRVNEIEYIPPDYSEELSGRTIIDITGDQFHEDPEFLHYNTPVYVGKMDEVHCLFDIEDIHECGGLNDVGAFNIHRLSSLYEKIKRYIDAY